MKTKGHKISVRLSDEENTLVTQRAKEKHLELSEYIRSMILIENKEVVQTKKTTSIFEDNQAMLMRLIINGYLKISALADEVLSEELIEDISQEATKQQTILGVEIKRK